MKKIILLFGVLLFFSNFCFAEQPTQINNGRYVMYMHPTVRADQYILDTKTGKVWHLVQAKDGSIKWEQMAFECYNDDKTSGLYLNPR